MRRTFRLSDSRPDPRRDVSDEIRFHLEMRAGELMQQGVPPERAWEEALRHFGDVGEVEAECREVRTGRTRERARRAWVRGIGMDLAYAARSLGKSTGFVAATVLTLGLGIGATASVFSVVDGVLLRPLPYADPSRLMMVWFTGQGAQDAEREWPLSSGFYLSARAGMRHFASMAAFRSWPFVLSGDGDSSAEPEQIAGSRAAPALFATLGVRPVIGRTFTEEEAFPGAQRVAVISWGLWQRRFAGAHDVVGRSITLSGERYTVIGVMPRGFAFPRGAELPPGLQFGARADVWAPLVFSDEDRNNYGTLNLAAVARLAPATTPRVAESEIVALGERKLREIGVPAGRLTFYLVSLKDQAAAKVRRGLLVLLGAVAFVLVIAYVNVANLLIARTGARQREFAIRSALGAGRIRIARQLATENVLLALGGAAVGVLVAVLGAKVMLALVPGNLPRADDVSVDARVIGVTVALAVAAGLAFAIGGALHLGGGSLAATLQSAGTRLTGGVRRRLGRRLLVAAEVALSVVLLVGAGLLAGSFARLQRVTPGFDPHGALTGTVLLPVGPRFDVQRDGPRWAAFFGQLTAQLDALPGVRDAGAVSSLPLSGAVESGGFAIEGRPAPAPGQRPTTQYSVVSGDYFQAMGIRLLAGRFFDSRDRTDGARVVIISRDFARRHFPGEAPIGRRILPGFDFSRGAREIIGVVEDVKQTTLDGPTVPAAYVPASQMPYPFMSIVVRTRCATDAGECDALATLPAVKRQVAALDPTLALSDVKPVAGVFADSLARQRFSVVVLGVFAISALALALVGLYGVVSLSVGQRTREIGVRMALGGQTRDIVGLVLGEGMRVTALGIAVGTAAALAVTRVLRSLLYDVSITDPRFFAGAALLVAIVALAATYLPARRAMRVDATVALRD